MPQAGRGRKGTESWRSVIGGADAQPRSQAGWRARSGQLTESLLVTSQALHPLPPAAAPGRQRERCKRSCLTDFRVELRADVWTRERNLVISIKYLNSLALRSPRAQG